MKLAYRTRTGSSPQGKPRVWYTGHPAEAALFAEEIFADLFKTQNCAVYYDAEPDAPFDEAGLLHELSQMQLFVVPVTSRFLYQPNRAREVEFAYAVRRHIPVLPLLQEQGLESAFNKICGDLQLLNKNDPDPTTLPYAQKLEKFLSSVLVGDELAAKVRAAFDAYVFLSYRKKDRKYAQELMRLIHKNAFCRDIAIWYDEFLTPGEDFNRAIADALQKCSLFTLAVTPNLLEPGNYVMAQEYPEAKRAGKPVLPVELAPTDRAALERSFEGLPLCTDAYNESALSGALLDAVRRLAIAQNDSDPEHNFFIGLAYLGGIDVEVDRTRALSLITGAADAGLPEAMEKLVAMYRSGDGVERNYHTAAAWQERLAKTFRTRYEQTGDERDWEITLDALSALQDQQFALGRFAAAHGTIQGILQLCSEDVFGTGDYFRMRAFGMLAGLYEAQSNPAEAMSYYRQQLALARQFYQLCKDEYFLEVCSDACGRMGSICQAERDLSGARKYFEQALALDAQTEEGVGAYDAKHNRWTGCLRLGKLCHKEGDPAKAQAYLEQAVSLARQLWEESGTTGAKNDLANSCFELGSFFRSESQYGQAEACYQECLTLYRQILDETGTLDARRNLLRINDQLGNLCWEMCDHANALRCHEKNLDEAIRIFAETGIYHDKYVLASVYAKIGFVCNYKNDKDENDLAKARECFLKAYALRRELCEESGTFQARHDLMDICIYLGDVCGSGDDLAGAKEYYLQSYTLAKQLAGDAGTVEARRDYAMSCLRMGDIHTRLSDPDAAEEYYAVYLSLTRQLAGETGMVRIRRDLAQCLYRQGNLFAENKPDTAQAYFEEAIGLYRKLLDETGARWAFLELAKAAGELGRLHLVNGRKEAAREPYRLSGLMWKQLAENYPGDTEYDYAKLARLDEQMLDALDREIREEQEAAYGNDPADA